MNRWRIGELGRSGADAVRSLVEEVDIIYEPARLDVPRAGAEIEGDGNVVPNPRREVHRLELPEIAVIIPSKDIFPSHEMVVLRGVAVVSELRMDEEGIESAVNRNLYIAPIVKRETLRGLKSIPMIKAKIGLFESGKVHRRKNQPRTRAIAVVPIEIGGPAIRADRNRGWAGRWHAVFPIVERPVMRNPRIVRADIEAVKRRRNERPIDFTAFWKANRIRSENEFIMI